MSIVDSWLQSTDKFAERIYGVRHSFMVKLLLHILAPIRIAAKIWAPLFPPLDTLEILTTGPAISIIGTYQSLAEAAEA